MFSLLVLVPFLILVAVNLSKKVAPNVACSLTALATLAQAGFVVSLPGTLLKTNNVIFTWLPDFKLAIDEFSIVVLAAIGIVAFVACCVARSTINDPGQRATFMNLLLVALIGMNTTVMLRDIFSIYLFVETIAIISFVLISIDRGRLALEGAFKYLMLSAFATILMLSSIALMLLFSPTLELSGLAEAMSVYPNPILIKLSIGLFLCGLFIKSGLFPFHWWLPDAYSAAHSAASVLLAGIITKVVGVYVLMRLSLSIFGESLHIQAMVMAVGALSIITGAVLAMTQKNFKRMLAYSSISQVGYIILATGVGTPFAFAAAAFHFFNHATFKSLLFVNAASVEKRLGTMDMREMGGLSNRMPATGITSLVGFLSTAGLPPFSGFWSKFMIVLALWAAGKYFYAAFALLASILTLGYMLILQRNVFFGKLKDGLGGVKEVGPGLVIPQLVLAAIIVLVGVCFPFVLNKFIFPVQSIFLK
ncbi:MAG: proton-conducting transporter membrane subunit [Candidatus Omnitrophica bacterium]|nr:proton-conducting transporter membrane subunit [Candidatus Omnitrophota bacterium]MDD5610256.1 proton-conducting transporter membrane subunit [Candidatus Omnitrophota bacterium]